MYTDFEYANKRLSDFDCIACEINQSGGVQELDMGFDITFNTVKDNHSSIHYQTSSSYDNVYAPQPFKIINNPCGKNSDELYMTTDKVRNLIKWLNRREPHKFKPIPIDEEIVDVYYFGSFNVKKITVNDRTVGLVLTFTSNAPYGFGEQIKNEVDFESNEVSVSGEVLNIKDSANYKILDFSLQGKTAQKTTHGNQLFDSSKLQTTTKNEVSCINNGDGSFTINGKGVMKGSFNHSFELTHEESIALLKTGTLYLNCDTQPYPYFYIYLKNASKVYYELGSYSSNNGFSYCEITQEMLEDEEFCIAGGFYGVANNTIVPTTIKPMLYQNGDGTWEQFTGGKASPSMKYPQHITKTEEIEVKFLGKNIWDKEYANDLNNWYINMYDSANKGYKEIAFFTGNGNEVTISYLKELQQGLDLYCGVVTNTTQPIKDRRWLYHPSGGGYINKSVTVTPTEGYVYIRFYGKLENFMQYIGNDLQIEYNSVVTEYEDHKKQTLQLTSDRPITKWDTLMVQDGQIGWGYRGLHLVIDGNANWHLYSEQYKGFVCDSLPILMNRREGYSNQGRVIDNSTITVSGLNHSDSIWLGVNSSYIYIVYNTFYDENLDDKGLANFKVHLNENPLEIWTYNDEIEFVPLPKEEQQALRNLMMYCPVTNIMNNQDCLMSLTYLQDYDNEFVICGDSDEYKTIYPNISITCKKDGDLQIKNKFTGNIFEVLNCSEGETIYVNGEHKFIDSDNENHKSTTLFNDFNYNYLDINVSEDDFGENIYNTSIPCKIVIDYSPIRKVGM